MAPDDEDDETERLLNALKQQWQQTQARGDDAKLPELQEIKSTGPLVEKLKAIFKKSLFQDVLIALLSDIVKPQLSAYKHAKLTDQGTVRIRPRDDRHNFVEINPPVETVSILRWVSTQLDKTTIQSNIHLLLPPILILLDSSHANVRTQATIILSNILKRVDDTFLAKTGLAEVFWTAIFPNLSALPPITDLDESVDLLRVTYPTLILLSRLWHTELAKRMALLDKVVREGFVHAMLFSGDKLKIVEVELESLNLLVEEMGIYFVKHLKHVIPIISSILANPLGGNHPPQLLSALNSLELVINTCNPRISQHHAEILRGTVTCWRYLRNQDSQELLPIRDSLKRVIHQLVDISPEAQVDITAITAIDLYFAELS